MGARPFGLNVFGPFMAKTGLGTAWRNMLAAIKETKLPFEVWNFDTSKGCARFAQVDKRRRPRFNINIIFANADQIEQVFLACPNGFFDDAYTIAVWQWELAAFRPDWFSAFGAVDEIWTNSRFQDDTEFSINGRFYFPVQSISRRFVFRIGFSDDNKGLASRLRVERAIATMRPGFTAQWVFTVNSTSWA